MPVETHPAAGITLRATDLGKAMTAGKYWRWTAWAVLGLLGMSLLGNVYLGAQPKWKPWYIEIDTCGGHVRVLGPAPETYTYAQLAVAATVRHFVEGLRGISMEVEETKKAWRSLEQQVTPAGKILLVREQEAYDPLHKQGAVVVEVLRAMPRAGSATTYDVRWQEIAYNVKRERVSAVMHSGLFTFVRRDPRTPEELTQAPLGIFFDEWHWAKDAS